jgi:hypothetical protein
MTASGHSRRFRDVRVTSAHPPERGRIADIGGRLKGPILLQSRREENVELKYATIESVGETIRDLAVAKVPEPEALTKPNHLSLASIP